MSELNETESDLTRQIEDLKRLFVDQQPFPNRLLGDEALESYLRKQARIKETDEGTLFLMFLGLCAVALGGKKKVRLGDWTEKAILWLVMVGKSGMGKTGVLQGAGLSFLQEWQGANIKKYRQEMEVYERRLSEWENATREEKRDSPRPNEPKPAKQCFSTLNTTESILEKNDDQPEGVSSVSDELAAILDSRGQYKNGKGNDQSVLLELFTGYPITNNLCGNRVRYLDDPFWCMVGGIQQELMKKIINCQSMADGSAARVLATFMREPERPLRWDEIKRLEESVTVAEQSAFESVFKRLLSERFKEAVYAFSPGAEALIREYQYSLMLKARNAEPHLYSPIKKLRTYVLRFALLLHCVRGGGERIEESVAVKTIELVEFLRQNQEKAFHIIFQDQTEEQMSMIVEKIREMGKATRKVLKHRLKRQIPFSECGKLIDELVKKGVLKECYEPQISREVFLQL